MEQVFIRGTGGSEAIEIYGREGLLVTDGSEYYRVRFVSGGIDVSQNVYAFDPKNEGLDLFFDELSSSIGTAGDRHWSSLEGEFEIRCACDSLGHAEVESLLHYNAGGPGWTVKLRFVMDAGQLERAAGELRRFFDVSR